jgi:thiamine-phosphate pyrophosphorylase
MPRPAARPRTSLPELPSQLRLYLVADPDHTSGDFVAMIEAALAGGVTSVQLRCKGRTDREVMNLARAIRAATHKHGALFLVNDRVDIALACGADGVHLGVDDLPIEDARKLGGSTFVVGFSPETDEQAQSARSRGADYLGVGPVFGTSTKSDAGAAIGLETISRRAGLAGVPIIGIGGITAANARSVIDAGAVGVAVVSAISMHGDPKRAAQSLGRSIER